MTSSIVRVSSCLLHGVLDLSQAGDLQPARVPGLEKDRRLAREAHAGRCARRDEIAGRERPQPRKVAYDVADAEDERLGIAALHLRSVAPALQPAHPRAWDRAWIDDVR